MTDLPVLNSRAAAETLPAILGQTVEQLAEWCRAAGYPAYRARQIERWIFGGRAHGFADMTDLPAGLRTKLADSFSFWAGEVIRRQVARDRTCKLLVRLNDGETLECVLMHETDRRTVCISTQVGCGMGCVFCASGMNGLVRNLTQPEILQQVLLMDRELPPEEHITNIVVMGLGEPLANLGNLLPVLDRLGDKQTLNLGARRITISTVGLPAKIREVAHVPRNYHLAISLHAPNDELRNQIVPTNRKTGLTDILAAADEYFAVTGRRVTYEYILLDGVNDQLVHARELATLLRERCAHVNLIPMNPVQPLPYRETPRQRADIFAAELTRLGINATIRKRKGEDIDAACGQLRLAEARPTVT